MLAAIKSVFQSENFCLKLLGLTLVLHISIVWSPMRSDDFLQWGVLAGDQELSDKGFVLADPALGFWQKISNQFNFVDAAQGNYRGLKEYGGIPWWTDPNAKVHLFRPLSSITHWLDYNVWPKNTVLMQTETLVMFLLLIVAIYKLYDQVGATKIVAGVAALSFSLDLSHVESLGWIASRNAILSPLFGVFSLLSFIKWRQTLASIQLCWCLVLLLCSLFAAEAGISIVGYFVAYLLWIESGPKIPRVLAFVPIVLTVVFWKVIYNVNEFGAANVAAYIDPAVDPLRFLELLFYKYPVLYASQNIGFDGLWRLFSIELTDRLWVLTVGLMILFILPLIPLLLKNSNCRFFFTGALLAGIPPCAITAVSARVFVFISIGFFLVIAEYLQYVFSGAALLKKSKSFLLLHRVFAGVFLFLHVALPFVVLVGGSLVVLASQGKINDAQYVFYDIESFDVKNRHVLFVNAPETFSLQFIPYKLRYQKQAIPETMRVLFPSHSDVMLTRTAERQFTLSVEHPLIIVSNRDIENPKIKNAGSMANYSRSHMGFFGTDKANISVGQKYEFKETILEIREVAEGLPLVVNVTLKDGVPLSDYLILAWAWKEQRFSSIELPRLGEKIVFEGP